MPRMKVYDDTEFKKEKVILETREKDIQLEKNVDAPCLQIMIMQVRKRTQILNHKQSRLNCTLFIIEYIYMHDKKQKCTLFILQTMYSGYVKE